MRILWIIALTAFYHLEAVEELKKISFYEGALFYKEHLQDSPIAFDVEEVIKGILAAHEGKEVFQDKEDLEKSIKAFQAALIEKAKNDNLLAANAFLEKISCQPEVKELVSRQLYYQIKRQGAGPIVEPRSMPLIQYTAKVLEKGNLEEVFIVSDPKPILLKTTTKGFAMGVAGMHEGETRELYVHPDLAYGSSGNKVAPNSLLVFEVTVAKVQPEPSFSKP